MVWKPNSYVKTEQVDSKTQNPWTTLTTRLGGKISSWTWRYKWDPNQYEPQNLPNIRIYARGSTEKLQGICQVWEHEISKVPVRIHWKHSRPIRRKLLKLAGLYLLPEWVGVRSTIVSEGAIRVYELLKMIIQGCFPG